MAAETIALTLIGWFVVPHLNEFLKKAYNVLTDDTKAKLTELQTVSLPRLEAMVQTGQMGGNENRLLSQLLKEFVEVSYEIQDAFDKSEYELLKQQTMGKVEKFVSSVTPSLFSKRNMSSTLKTLDQKVSSINNFYKGLPQLRPSNRADAAPITSLREIQPTEEILGRDTDIQNIVSSLTETPRRPNNLKVVVIIGVGGVGKTELAKCIYNRINVGPKMWIPFPRGKFDEVEMTQCMMDFSQDGSFFASTTLEVLGKLFRKSDTGKKFLLVFDDVWYDEDLSLVDNQERWRRLCAPLHNCDQGGMILITSRMEIVAESFSLVSGEPTRYFLEGLEDQDCLAIFERHAFGDAGPDQRYLDANLPTIAGEIVNEVITKLEGIPLAAREAGLMLKNKYDPEDWRRIKNNVIQEATKKSLMWSYRMLPQQLQRCAVHLSLYPRGFKFDPSFLVLSWIAADVITHREGSASELEDEGRRYFNDLVSRSFFQKEANGLFVLHHALHVVSDIITMEECMRITGDGEQRGIPLTIKHLSIEANKLNWYREEISKLEKLRSLFVTCNNAASILHDVDLEAILKKMKRLRALRLACCTINKLPDSVGRSKHLRFLDLSNSSINQLPESVCSVYHLWYLDLNNCRLDIVPKDLNKLIKLRYLVSDGATLSMIPHIGRLTLLRELKEFHVKRKRGHDLGQLKDMDHLQGALRIRNLEAVGDARDADEAMLKRKTQLKEFVPEWSKPGETTISEQVLDKLQPHDRISSLTIRGYASDRTPSWMGRPNPNLETLVLSNCTRWGTLPALAKIYTNLKKLVLSDCCINDNTLAKCLKNLAFLSHLELSECLSMTTLPSEEVMRPLKSLESVIARDCANLESVGGLEVLAPTDGSGPLRRLLIQNCDGRLQRRLPPNLRLLMQPN